MVKKGFMTIPGESQERIIKSALIEFAANDYQAASFNSIIARAGISKGSMYYYFHNKEDLFLYLIELAMEEKARYLREALASAEAVPGEMGFFDNLELQLSAAVDFAARSNLHYQLLLRFTKLPDSEMKARITGNYSKALDQYFENLISEGQSSGEIRSDFEPAFIKRLTAFIISRFTDLYPDSEELLDSAPGGEALKNEVYKLVEFLKRGIRKDKANPAPGSHEQGDRPG